MSASLRCILYCLRRQASSWAHHRSLSFYKLGLLSIGRGLKEQTAQRVEQACLSLILENGLLSDSCQPLRVHQLLLQVVVHLVAPVPLATNHLHCQTWAVSVLIQGVDEREGGHGNGQHNQRGDDGPDHLQRRVVCELLWLQLLGVVELGSQLSQQVDDHDGDGDQEKHDVVVQVKHGLCSGCGRVLEQPLPWLGGICRCDAAGQHACPRNDSSSLCQAPQQAGLLLLGGSSASGRGSRGCLRRP
mmetsp:Transcript_773/g.1949  ORF Transcript_773/g.1949 Transcript_773/m.1949 type:complete len:245 (-) Transcript_773:498-1232(-)